MLIQLLCGARTCFLAFCLLGVSVTSKAGNIAYIHGDVSECGTTPSSAEQDNSCEDTPFDQMLIDDSGSRGLSEFADLVTGQGHTINQFYDMDTTLDAQFFEGLDVVVFSLHQKIWSVSERAALGAWLNDGGGMFIYSDSASGGLFSRVGGDNPVGQNATNNLLQDFDLEVTVDQANGIRAVQAKANTSITAINNLVLEGEGVSPVAVKPDDTTTEILVPFDCSNCSTPRLQGVSLPRIFAALVLRPVGQGHVGAMFDRQPMWNDGPGSDINEEDNRIILSELINFLAERESPPTPPVTPPNTPPNTPSNADSVILPPLIDLLLQED